MELSKEDLASGGKIYLEATGTLAARIDFAWDAYTDETYTKNERADAFLFLLYALDIVDTENVNSQLIQLMSERKEYKEANPEYIPGKLPLIKNFDPKKEIPKQTIDDYKVNSPAIRKAISYKELLDNRENVVDRDQGTVYLTPEQRAAYRVNISNGVFKKNGELFSTTGMSTHAAEDFAAFTLNSNGELSVFTHTGGGADKIFHSSMNAGAPVVAAGELKIEKGVLKAITTHSGHYQPSLFHTYRTLEHFASKNINIREAKVLTFEEPLGLGVEYEKIADKKYETNAAQFFKTMDKLIIDNVDTICDQVKTYQKGDLLTRIYRTRDRVTGSTLTQDRAKLAAKFEKALIEFKQGCKDISPENLPLKIEELNTIIDKFQGKNQKLSLNAKKESSNGRLENKMVHFKKQLLDLKEKANDLEIAPPDIRTMRNMR